MGQRTATKSRRPTRKREGIGMRIVGPAAALDARDNQSEEELAWGNVREAFVTLGKRMGTIVEVTKVAKQVGVDEPIPAPATPPVEDPQDARGDLIDDLITPPFDFATMAMLFENSGPLRWNIDAMATNIDGFGHRFVPVLEFTHPEINNKIRDMLLHQRLAAADALREKDLLDLTTADLNTIEPTIEEIEETKQRWQKIAAIERQQVANFFEFVNPLESFTKLRKKSRESKELLGNAGWEVIREDPTKVESKISQVYAVPFVNMRLIALDKQPTDVDIKVRKDPITFGTIKVQVYFRRFVRLVDNMGSRVYYKQFGDPRVVSRKTGQYYATVEEMRTKEGGEALPANEFMHDLIESQLTPYGVPRWISETLSVMGSRASSEVNFLYFDNKAIPPMVMLVSGGKLSEPSVKRIEDYIEQRVKGRKNFHRIMVIEGLPAGAEESSGDVEPSGKVRVELKPLMGHQMQDALFQEYDQNNILKIGRSFRQPQLLTGDTRDMNRSTAEVAKAFAEEQIYQPARDEFDAMIDRHIMVNIGIHFWRFETYAPAQRIPNDLVKNVKESLSSGAMTPNEARPLLADAFGVELDHRNEEWANTPPPLALAAARMGGMPGVEPVPEDPDNPLALSEAGGRSRAADMVQEIEGAMVARGRTGERDGHDHVFVAVRAGDLIRFMLMPGGDDGHAHDVAPVPYAEGVEVTAQAVGHGHGHKISFSTPLSKKRRRAVNIALALHALRQEISSQFEEEKTKFFDAVANSTEQDEDEPPRSARAAR